MGLYLPLVEIRESPEFHDLMREDKAHWPRCLLWHGWLPMLSGVHGVSPWAADASESAGPLQSVQRAEMWGVILALQSSSAVHLVVDNLGVVRHVGRLLDGHHGSVPLELVKDGDLLLLIGRVLRLRGLDTVRVTKVKGHADEGMVHDGRVRELDRLGNDAADEAADFGRRRVGNAVIDARRNLSGVCGRWYPVILDLHRFFIAISQAVVNHDGRDGTAPDPLVWSAGAHPKRRLVHAVRDQAFLPGPPGIWDSELAMVPPSAICAEHIAHWPHTTGLLNKWVAFFGHSALACWEFGSWGGWDFLCGIAHSL